MLASADQAPPFRKNKLAVALQAKLQSWKVQ